MAKRIIISKGTELVRVPADCLMYVSSDGNYSNLVTSDGRSRIVTFQLGQIEDVINDQLGDDGMIFLRLGRSLIINTEYIYLVDVAKQLLILSDFHGSFHELRHRREYPRNDVCGNPVRHNANNDFVDVEKRSEQSGNRTPKRTESHTDEDGKQPNEK